MKWLTILFLLFNFANSQTSAPTTNVTVPDVATLRPTITPEPTTPTDMPTMDPADLPKDSSGEPARVVVVATVLVIMVALTVAGICLIANGDNECEKRPIRQQPKTNYRKITKNNLW